MSMKAFLSYCYLITCINLLSANQCDKVGDRKPRIIDGENKYKLWPGLTSNTDLKLGENIFGVHEAMEKIWRNQNPPDCSKAKYLISGEWLQGFGSEFYFHGVALAIAMDTDRVFLQHGGFTWRYNNEFCRNQSKSNMECYLLPYSKCTLQDAMNAIAHNHPKKTGSFSHKLTIGDRSVTLNRVHTANINFPNAPLTLTGPTANDPVVMVTDRLILNHHLTMIPHSMQEILSCAGMEQGAQYLWWRSISLAYLMRPNQQLLDLLEVHRDKSIQNAQGNCVSAYIRHGDKDIEMKLHPFSAYADISLELFDILDKTEIYSGNSNSDNNSNSTGDSNSDISSGGSSKQSETSSKGGKVNSAHGERIFYVATEDKLIFSEAKDWGKKNHVKVVISELSQKILTSDAVLTPKHLQESLPQNRELEFFSYFLHLFDASQCIYTICTHASNFCRVIDSMRSTVGGKANRYSVDLSAESCINPPCWRQNSLGNYNGTVHNPNRIVWRA